MDDREFPAERITICTAQLCGQQIVQHSACAYWFWHDESRKYHVNRTEEAFRELAKILGYEIVKREGDNS